MNKRSNSKFFKLKKWLKLPEAATYISEVFNEEITEADILRWALDGHLKLSVYLIHKTVARRGNIVGYEDVTWEEIPREFVFRGESFHVLEVNGDKLRYMESLQIDDTRFLNISHEHTTIEGLWDVPMFGCGWIDIENKYQRLTGGPEVGSLRLAGPLVEGADKELYLVGKNCFAEAGYGPRTKAQIAKIQRLELSKSKNKRKEKILMLRKALFWAEKNDEFKAGYGKIFFGPGLPEDSVLVLRPEVMEDFTQRMLDSEAGGNTATKVHGNAERHAANREQVLGAAFAVLAKWPDECRDKKGEPLASKIAAKVDAMADLFWPDAQPPLATESIAEHLRDWIKKANNSRK